MILSMTGYGKKETQWEDRLISLEIRALNSKTADVNLRTPAYLRELDTVFRKHLASRMHRGKIDLTIYVEFNGENAPTKINTQIVNSYIKQLESLAEATPSERLALAMRLPDTLTSERNSLSESEKKILFILLDQVIDEITHYRKDEGESLEKDFMHRIEKIENYLEDVKKIDPERNQKVKAKLRNALDELEVEIDHNRFEQELIYYLEKFDITEEKVRLTNHLAYFKKAMSSTEPIGKKLGFIAQEIGREINTIGSKANHAELQKIVVQMKDELEKIKEQLLNVL
ncbi:MAG: YicC/YloC family endoribonuclease [Flavobacteriaceae bacterium]